MRSVRERCTIGLRNSDKVAFDLCLELHPRYLLAPGPSFVFYVSFRVARRRVRVFNIEEAMLFAHRYVCNAVGRMRYFVDYLERFGVVLEAMDFSST